MTDDTAAADRAVLPPHVGYDELADLDASLLSPGRADQVRAHLAGCAECKARQQQVAAVASALGGLADAPMPDQVREHVLRMLADEATAPAGSGRRRTVVPMQASRSRRFATPTMAGAAAAVVIVAAVAAIVVGHNGNSTNSTPTASGGQAVPNAAGTPTTTTDLVPTASQQVVTTGSLPTAVRSFVLAGRAAQQPGSATSSAAATPPSGSTTPDLGFAGTSHVPASTLPTSVRGLYSSTPRLQRCAASLSPDTPVAVGFARWTSGRYHAAPSAFFVYRLASGKGEVFVVDPSCSGGSVRTFVNNVQLP